MRRAERVALATLATLTLVACSAPSAGAQVWEVGNILLKSLSPVTSGQFGFAVATGDFDGDGKPDLAVGSPGKPSVTFFHGGGADRTLFYWTEITSPNPDELGIALAVGDFDGDGRDEIAVGAPAATVSFNGSDIGGAGRVVVEGYDTGCSCIQFVQSISQADTPGFSPPETNDHFGSVLAAADFNNDGFADLAVGVPDEDVGGIADAGGVQVFFGGASGIRTDNPQGFRAGAVNVLGIAGSGDRMGAALAAGDFDGDGYRDIAVGAPGRKVSGTAGAGQIHVLRGSSTIVTTVGQQLLGEDAFGGTTAADGFGSVLAAGDLDGDPRICAHASCYDDLVIGVPQKTVNGHDGAGEVIVAAGASFGVDGGTSTVITQAGNGETPEAGDLFGASLAVGSLDGFRGAGDSSPMDLAFGSPNEDLGALPDEGLVQLLLSGAPGHSQAVPEKAGFKMAPAATSDFWGRALAIADFDGDGWGDLVVGADGKTEGGKIGAGAVEVLFGALFADGFESGGKSGWSTAAP